MEPERIQLCEGNRQKGAHIPEFWSLEGETIDGDLIYETPDGCNVTAIKRYAKNLLKELEGGHIDILWEGNFLNCIVEI